MSRPAPAFRRTATLYGLALAAIFCAQELTEGAIATGHPAGLAAVLADGGWVFLPLALAIGALVLGGLPGAPRGRQDPGSGCGAPALTSAPRSRWPSHTSVRLAAPLRR